MSNNCANEIIDSITVHTLPLIFLHC